jgi:glutamate formiminotransferase/formiminotetrahydrofolate cyclodeaminase
LIAAVDEDTAAFNEIMKAYGLPKEKPEEVEARKKAISDATKYAAEVPLKVARLANESFLVIEAMAEIGNPNSITDAGVGALCARAAVKGAAMNVRINLQGFKDIDFVKQTISEVEKLEKAADEQEKEINEKVMNAIV